MAKFDTQGELKNVKQEIGKLNWTTSIVAIALIVSLLSVIVGFIGFVVDAHRFKASTYQDLVNKINILVVDKETKEKTTEQQRIDTLETQLKTIKEKNPYIKY